MPYRPTQPAAPATFRRPRSRGRMVLGAFAMLASMGIAMVTVVDPYAGATASAYYRLAGAAPSTRTVQHFQTSDGVISVAYKNDTWQVIDAPTPKAAGAKGKAASDDSAATIGAVAPAGTSQAYAAGRVADRGWNASQFSCLVSLWNRESGWRVTAANPSGAYGIPQALPGSKMGAGWQSDYKAQIDWGLGYIAGSYGSPCGAWAHSNAVGWY